MVCRFFMVLTFKSSADKYSRQVKMNACKKATSTSII